MPPTNSWAAPGFENAPSQHDPIRLPVKGQIPSWLSGSLYRTGPGTFRVQPASSPSNPKPPVDIHHWFDGLGMNHHFRITPSGEVYYSNRSSSDSRIKEIEELGHVPGITFGAKKDPCESLFTKFFTFFVPSTRSRPPNNSPDRANVSVTLTTNLPGLSSHNATKSSTDLRYLVAKTDANMLQVLDPETLEPLELTSYARLDKRLDGHLSAAHSCVDPETGEFFNYVQKFGAVPTYKVFKVIPAKNDKVGGKHKVEILAEITDAPLAYLHSFALTKQYVVLSVWQSDYGMNGASVKWHGNLMDSMKAWNPNRDTLFYVIDREKGGIVAKYKSSTFFTLHTINAYESNGSIIIDLAYYPDNSILNLLYLDHLRAGPMSPTGKLQPIRLSKARRFVLENVVAATESAGKAREAKVEFELPIIELPTIHPALYGSKYRFAYGIHKTDDDKVGVFADKIIKLDMSSPSSPENHKTWGEEGYTTGEPIFIPHPDARPEDEDNGVILTIILDGNKQRSMLVVLDAREMKEIARAEMDRCFPLGFHGVFSKL